MEEETSPPANQKQIEALAKRIEGLEGMICHMDAEMHDAKMKISELESTLERWMALFHFEESNDSEE